MTHGTVKAYRQGCRDCPKCRAANARYRNTLRAEQARGITRMIDPTGTRRRILALGVMRWPYTAIGTELGVHHSRVGRMVRAETVHRDTAKAVAEMYDRLCMKTGPGDLRTEMWARRAGGYPPLAWDNIDDPNEEPHNITPAHRSDIAAERIEDITWLLDAGCGWGDLTARLGLKVDSIYNACHRANRPDLVARLRQLRQGEDIAA